MYRSELERCFEVWKTGKNGKPYKAYPRKRSRKPQEGSYIPVDDTIKAGISNGKPGSAQRITDLARFYENNPESSAFNADLATQIVDLITWRNCRRTAPSIRATIDDRIRQERAEQE